jgi:hypothetical protein
MLLQEIGGMSQDIGAPRVRRRGPVGLRAARPLDRAINV